MRRAALEPDIEDIIDLGPVVGVGHGIAEEALFGARLEPGVGALLLEGLADAVVDCVVLEYLVLFDVIEHGDPLHRR